MGLEGVQANPRLEWAYYNKPVLNWGSRSYNKLRRAELGGLL